MTTIAWDGITLAADKRAANNGLSRTVTKLYRLSNGSLFASCGDLSFCLQMKTWIENGCDIENFPNSQRDKDDWQNCVIIDKEGIGLYERTPELLRFEDKHYACGSGRDYALAAMHCGKTAIEAVEIASIFDIGSGNGVDFMRLE